MLALSLAVTVALLVLAWFVLTQAYYQYFGPTAVPEAYAIRATIGFLLGIGLVFGLAYLVPAVTALAAGFFADDAAAVVEAEHYPQDPPGRPLPAGTALLYGARFAGLSLIVNATALLVFLVPGVNLVVFFVANSYLLGREYFELAASRFRPMAEAAAMRQRHRGTVFVAGLMIAALVAVPILNLLTPLFGIALMVHVHKRLAALESGARNQLPEVRRSEVRSKEVLHH